MIMSASPRRGRPRDPEKLRNIMQMAGLAFLEHGFGEATMDLVASRAGVSKVTLYNYFPSKLALFEACVRQRTTDRFDGFDAEQIWLQLELAAGPALKRARKLLKKAGEEPLLLTPETEEAIDGGLTWAGWQAGWLTCSRFGGGCFRGWWKLALGHAPGQPQWHAACNAFNHSPLICRPLACSLQSCWRVLRVVPATRTMMRLDQGVREMRRMLTWQT